MVFNATFNNISVILWWLVLLEETTDLPQVTDKLYHMLHRGQLAWAGFELTALIVVNLTTIWSRRWPLVRYNNYLTAKFTQSSGSEICTLSLYKVCFLLEFPRFELISTTGDICVPWSSISTIESLSLFGADTSVISSKNFFAVKHWQYVL
jgi:hypothetical protein